MIHQKPFKIIVVGGGPVGLTAAHILSRAGIDYVVLERRSSIQVDIGASLALWPQGLRVLSQLGLLETLRELGEEMGRTTTVTLGGHKYKETWATETMKENHGARATVFHRADIVNLLYETLKKEDKARIYTDKKVIGVTSDRDGIAVRCGDGSTYRGAMTIGADGVHSKVRQSMRELAVESFAPRLNAEKPYVSKYKVLWCSFPRQPCNEPGDTVEIHGRDVSLQCLSSQKRSWLFIYERLVTPTRERVSYSQQDVEEFAGRHGELAVCEHLKVKDVFAKRYTAGMTNLEEGIVEHWSWDRMVLVGDACHKFTPNQGLGYNNGIQDLVALVNELNRALSDDHRSGRAVLPVESLTGVFSRYQDARMELLQKDLAASASWTRMSAWRSCILHLLDRYVLPAIPKMDELAITYMVSGPVSRTLVLDFVESEEPFQGKVAWKHAMTAPKEASEKVLVSSQD